MKFRVGDKVSFNTNQEIIFGTIINISIDWSFLNYYVKFEGNKAGLNLTMWMREDELTLIIDKEKVVFT